MPIDIQLDENHLRVIPGKQFDYTLVNAFFEGINPLSDNIKSIEIDCTEVQYADSAAIGMILQLQERFPNTPIAIAQCKAQPYRLFYIARFERQFTMTQYEHINKEPVNRSNSECAFDEMVA